MRFRTHRAALGILLGTLTSASAVASTVYSNIGSPIGSPASFYGAATEFGDEVTLFGTDRVLQLFSFYYYLDAASVGQQTAVFRIYDNAGPGGAPGRVLFTSDAIALSTGYNSQTVSFDSGPPILLPDTLTWTVQFFGVGQGEAAGLLLYNPPDVGSSFNDFWQRDVGDDWGLMQIISGLVPGNFAAHITTRGVSEPLGALNISRLGSDLLLDWTGGTAPFVVERADTLAGAWLGVSTNVTRNATVPMSGAVGFLRVRGS